MMYLYLPTSCFWGVTLLFFITFVGIESYTPLTAQGTAYHLTSYRISPDNHQKWINYYAKELEPYGRVRQLEAQRGISHDLRPKNAMHHHLRFITTPNNHPGYYPKIRLTYYNQSGGLVGVYTSSSSDIIRMGDGKAFLQVDLLDIPTDSYRTTLTILEGEGTILTVFE